MTVHRYFPGPPDHVPPHLIHEFDIYRFAPGVNDPLEQWGNLLASDAPRIFYTHHNGGHWVFLDYEDVREAIRNLLSTQLAEARYVQQLRRSAHVEVREQ